MSIAEAFLSLSSTSPTSSLHIPSSSFKGNVTNFKPNPSGAGSILSPRLSFKNLGRERRQPLLVVVSKAAEAQQAVAALEKVWFRLNNLGPQPGSRKKAQKKGRGISAGQGNSCGFGMRGQKSRSGPGVRKGFEGGQMPLYRRIPKLRGIAGGMHAELPKFVPVNLKDIEAAGFQEGDEVSLETLRSKGSINPSGRARRLQGRFNILGDGELIVKLNIKARAFSTSAKEKLEAAGRSLTVLPERKKWVKPSVAKSLACAEEYFTKKRAAAADTAEAASA